MLAPHRSTKAALSKARPRPSLETTPRTSEDTADESADAPVPVLPSSTELFYFYGQNLDQCAKLSTGKPLFDLCKVHKKWLRIYAGKFYFFPALPPCIVVDWIFQRTC
jgi:vacuolar protein sorting-associated protein 53